MAFSVAGLGRLVRAAVLGAYPHGQPKDVPPAPAQPNMPDITQVAAVAGPPARVDPAAEVRRAAARQLAPGGGTTPSIATAAYLFLGYVVPVSVAMSAAVALAARIRRRPAPRRRFLGVPLAAFFVFAVRPRAVALTHGPRRSG